MKSFNLDGMHYTFPTIHPNLSLDGRLVFEVMDGDCRGMKFVLTNLRATNGGKSVSYDLTLVANPDGAHVDELKPLVDNFILYAIATKAKLT